ncbi:TonB-dependent receptor [bacterium SCSIO 12696]|nr:TonB-dependent receptor [bacterium SCSIO 12696]
MNHTLSISNSLPLLLVGTFAFPAAAEDAQQNTDKAQEEIITTASPVHNDQDKVIQGITVLSGDLLLETAAASIGETLKNQPGISTASFGPSVGLPVIRGQNANRVKVLQNNIDTLDASNTSPDHASGTEPLLAERIEVLRGPSTLRFGNGAIGGVVNVIDNRIPTTVPEGIESALELRHNSANNGDNAVFKIDGGEGNFAWHLDGVYRSSNNISIDGPALLEEEEHEEEEEEHEEEETTIGFVDNSDANTKSASAGFAWVDEDNYAGFSISRLENNYGIPPGAHAHEEGEEEEGEEEEEEIIRIDLEQTRYDFKAQVADPWGGFESLNIDIAYNDYEHVELEGDEVGTRFTVDGWEGRIEAVHNPWENWHGAIGLQLKMTDFAAVGEEAFFEEDFFVAPVEISNYGFFWLEDLQTENWHLELGVRTERQEITPVNSPQVAHNTTTLSVATQWLFADNQHFSISLTSAERAPTVEELFSNGAHLATRQFIFGDTSLEEEASTNFELGYHYHGDFELSAIVYQNDIRDFIYQLRTGEEMEGLPVFNYIQQDAVFTGFEITASKPITDTLTVNVFGDQVRASLDSGLGISRDVPRITPTRYGAELEYQQDQWSAKLRWTEVDDQNRAGEGETTTPGYTDVDANISYKLNAAGGDHTLFLKVGNLLDEQIRHSTSFLRNEAPAAGRHIQVGIRTTF